MRDRIRGLDGLRGLAALSVLVHHALISRTRLGTIAVDLFFVLSGFLIISILHGLRRRIDYGETSSKWAFADFWRHRALRIFPAYYATVLLFAGACWIARLPTDAAVWHLAYVQNFAYLLGVGVWPGMQHTWSLAVEQQFYVLFAAVLLFTRSKHHFAIVASIGLVSVAAFSVMAGYGMWEYGLMEAPTTAFPYLAAGGLIALRKMKASAGLALVAAIILALIIASGLDKGATVEVPYWLCKAVELPCIALIMAYIVGNQHARIVRFLELRAFIALGAISYSLYLLHVPVMMLVTAGFDWAGIPYPMPNITIPIFDKLLFFGCVSIASISAAAIMRVAIERSFLSLKPRQAQITPGTALLTQSVVAESNELLETRTVPSA